MKYEQIKTTLSLNLTKEEKCYQLFLMSLSPYMRAIFSHIPKGVENAITVKDLKIKTGFESKNISSQINNIKKKFPIKDIGTDKIKAYYI